MMYRLNFLSFLAGCSTIAVASVPPLPSSPGSAQDFDWSSIKPNTDLEYHDCYGEFKCARLQLPLGWLNKTDPRTTAIAIIKLPAAVADDDPAFGGSIFTNPGGPGGSGVQFAQSFAHQLRRIADKPGRRHYEIVSFDPRGIANTTPRSDCYHHDMLKRGAADLEFRGNGALNRSPASVVYGLALMANLGRQCEENEENWGDVMSYVGTPSVARDMVEMLDKIDELRRREAAKKSSGSQDDEARPELKKRHGGGHGSHDKPDVPRLQYIGFSYGTILGNYFASMFPGRVGRIILDGVCNADDYATGPGWLTNTVDTDEVFDNFLSGCHKAGPDVCKLARASDSSVKDLETRFWSWIHQLDEAPQAVTGALPGSRAVVSGTDVLSIIGLILYSPIAGFKPLAALLDDAMSGNLNIVGAVLVALGIVPQIGDACLVGGNSSAPLPRQGVEALSAVVCGDGEEISGKDAAWWRKYVDYQLKKSTVLGAMWSNIRFICSSWPFRANWIFKGPFTTPEADPAGVEGRPSAPLLFLSNRLDPVTPLSAARAMAANHPGAAVVVQEAMGHCATVSAPSRCTRRIISEYFDTGIVPSEETSCNATCGPWDDDCQVFSPQADVFAFASSYDHSTVNRLPLRKFPLGI